MPSCNWQHFYKVLQAYRPRLHWHWEETSLKAKDWRIVIVLIDRQPARLQQSVCWHFSLYRSFHTLFCKRKKSLIDVKLNIF